ncbi:DUF3426 domain-containing protein [Marinomonas rhizomae]|uniref:Putative Zn finger-like uncharacterized protein n=1 Tax=Marinomonas rhizomae TaxID=491948 RepID=A0A366J8T4_9GAMM|nr:zinc-ribbon and DUF3426 domain-containing protein [Marinomonas rhizomae]RBP83363.1 putative Zn finger-like uncharacterized protein [Marinomonas rhizomae]RNF73923.1 DUF3426 domain-containing protein [Marinomonas rhizomae]
MASSLITRCPKCSTAFRVSDEVLSMAKGKVRCGQCFHIFNASDTANNKTTAAHAAKKQRHEHTNPTVEVAAPNKKTLADSSHQATATEQAIPTRANTDKLIDSRLAPAEDIVNPDWLHTLFDDEDLQPPSPDTTTQSSLEETEAAEAQSIETSTVYQDSARKQEQAKYQAKKVETEAARQDEPAPWEVELAEVEAALQATQQPAVASKPITKPSPAPKTPVDEKPSPEPDYMVALHSLAQTAAEQTRPSDIKNQHTILEQLSAQQSLAPLMGESTPKSRKKNNHPWLWFFASLLGVALLTAQVATHFFEEGSRSSNFRAMYKTICSYSGCSLPRFEDISAISIQHVRIQSHPSIPNTLLVNAIITNTSDFSQPMPKIALEFFDLNGLPVAARLFAPSDYLHKDFLDITYMPPNTPIHLVIPIQDPGARAVTHQLRAFPTDTRSY